MNSRRNSFLQFFCRFSNSHSSQLICCICDTAVGGETPLKEPSPNGNLAKLKTVNKDSDVSGFSNNYALSYAHVCCNLHLLPLSWVLFSDSIVVSFAVATGQRLHN